MSQMACSDRLFLDNCILLVLPQVNKQLPHIAVVNATRSSSLIVSKIGKYFVDFNFRGLMQTAKFRENWTTRKFPVLRYY